MVNQLHRLLALVALLVLLSSCTTTDEQPPQPPPEVSRDSAGWTTFSPSSDSRIIYVSSQTGNDATGETYSSADAKVAANPRNPGHQPKAFKTFGAAFKHTREGHPDWILLKRGDTFHGSVDVRNGRSDNEPFLLASYGSASQPPLVKTGSDRGLKICCKSFAHIAVQGLEFYAHTRDFDSPYFASTDGGSGVSVYVEDGHNGTGLLIEGCKFRFFTGNAIQTDGRLTNAVFRRNVILDNYSTTGHSQGLFTRNVSMVVEENIFDHNGWYRQQTGDMDNREDGKATMFNHNTYFEDSRNVTFRNNIFLRPSSIGNKWTANTGKASAQNIQMINNFYMDGEIGISIGGNKKGPLRFRNITIRDNVMVDIGQSKPTDRDFAWYLDVKDWDEGVIENNVFVHPGSKTTNNIFAIKFDGDTREVKLYNNHIYGFGNGHALAIGERGARKNVRIADNHFHLQQDSQKLVRAASTLNGIEFANNKYISESASNPMFAVRGNNLSLQEWKTRSGDTDFSLQSAQVADLGGLVRGYHASLGRPASRESFIRGLRAQSHTNWNTDYTAQSINSWIRQNLPGKSGIANRQNRESIYTQ